MTTETKARQELIAVAMRNYCDIGHEQILYQSEACPLCAAIRETAAVIEALAAQEEQP